MVRLIFDFVVVGAGIIGLTVANELRKRHPNAHIAILEKEASPGMHASGRNSGVLHSGIYYSSDTHKARICAEGSKRMVQFAQDEGISYSQSGKVILATSENQLPTIDKLLNNAYANNILAEKIDQQQLHEIEPYAANGVAAIYCPTTAVIDSKAVVKRLKEKLQQVGVVFLFDTEVHGVLSGEKINTSNGNVSFGYLYNCAGAYADKIAKLFGVGRQYELVPFKGIYWKLGDLASSKVRANIYPVPDITMPFLGVHLTRVINGDVFAGPTAIPALGRENYGRLTGIRAGEALQVGLQLSKMYMNNKGDFRKMARHELAKYQKRRFFKEAQKLMPSLNMEDLAPTPKAGIRPQLINTKTGKLEMDYLLETTENSMHVLNSISPAFTSSFAFAQWVVDESNQ